MAEYETSPYVSPSIRDLEGHLDKKLVVSLAVGAVLGFVGFSSAPQDALASTPCVRTKFDTKLVADACKAGGQEEAKKVMKQFVKDARDKDPKLTLDCKSCHTSLGPNFDLKTDGLKQFTDLGGK
jgi:hypothetical protein